MLAAQYLLLQDRLSTAGSFSLCDARCEGFPILYASRGFVELFGYTAKECIGTRCGSLVGPPSILEHDPGLRGLAGLMGMAPREIVGSLELLTANTRREVALMMQSPGEHVAQVQLVNRKKSGELFVCEVIMFALVHRHLGWTFSVGLQHDITDDVSIKDLLARALSGELPALRESREGVMSTRLAGLRMQSLDVSQYLEDKAGDMWLGMLQS